MAVELEIKLLDVNVEHLEKRLNQEGATLIYKGAMKNAIFYGVQENDLEYLRLRDDSKQVTLTYKRIHPDTHLTTEHEIAIDSYDTAVQILESIGLKFKRKDEKRRTRYKLGDVFIDIDTWPHIPTYVEIEGSSEEELLAVCARLGLNYQSKFNGDTLDVFRHYGIDPNKMNVLEF